MPPKAGQPNTRLYIVLLSRALLYGGRLWPPLRTLHERPKGGYRGRPYNTPVRTPTLIVQTTTELLA